MAIRVMLADNHPLILAGASEALSTERDIQVIGTASSPQALHSLVAKEHCDVVATEMHMAVGPSADGFAMIHSLLQNHPSVRIVVLTSCISGFTVAAMVNVGVLGILSKTDPAAELAHAIREAYRGREFIGRTAKEARDASLLVVRNGENANSVTWREAEVVRLWARGLTVGKIAQSLSRSVSTVSQQKRSAMRKLGLSNDAALHRFATEHQLNSRP
ncbi:Transcriptional regulatory protein RcsB [compost metagenome]